jgi:hypothetical protein
MTISLTPFCTAEGRAMRKIVVSVEVVRKVVNDSGGGVFMTRHSKVRPTRNGLACA